jgi:protein-tyrosine phosphatase
MPVSVDFVRQLNRDQGITGVVSVQTDEDLLNWGFDWPQMERLLRRGGIEASRRVPIVDFSEGALANGLPEAVAAVAALRRAGHPTYVHCTAGINRSPTVAIGYLVAHEGFPLDQAWHWLHQRRAVMPLRQALERWLAEADLAERQQPPQARKAKE